MEEIIIVGTFYIRIEPLLGGDVWKAFFSSDFIVGDSVAGDDDDFCHFCSEDGIVWAKCMVGVEYSFFYHVFDVDMVVSIGWDIEEGLCGAIVCVEEKYERE